MLCTGLLGGLGGLEGWFLGLLLDVFFSGRVTTLHFGHNPRLISSICCSLISSSSSSVVFFDKSNFVERSICGTDSTLCFSS